MNAVWGWDPEKIKEILSKPAQKYKYFITDDQDEFVNRLEIIANNALQNNKDNLKYLERMDEIRRIREGEDIFKVLPWLKKDKDNA
jgi:CRISPR/Cas system CMR-associated protein Cmr5 small subunit